MDFRGISEFMKDSLKFIAILAVAFIIFVYVISLQQVIGSSMSPTLNDENIVLIDKIRYHFFDIKRNDIVSFKYKDSEYLIKRVIGLPGERIKYKNNQLYVNGNLIEEKFLENIETEDFELFWLGYDTIPDNMYLVLGDNRNNSIDSRNFGLIKKENIVGKMIFKIG